MFNETKVMVTDLSDNKNCNTFSVAPSIFIENAKYVLYHNFNKF